MGRNVRSVEKEAVERDASNSRRYTIHFVSRCLVIVRSQTSSGRSNAQSFEILKLYFFSKREIRFANLISGHKSATFSVRITSSLYMTSFRAGYVLAAMTT